jgi:hypothetical protein
MYIMKIKGMGTNFIYEGIYTDMNWQWELHDHFEVNSYLLVLGEEQQAALQHALKIFPFLH